LVCFYYAGAMEHGRTVNTFKARGDQSAYLAEAELVYANWTGQNNPPTLHPRNRMPLYPAFLAVLYDPVWSDDEFFVHAKLQSVVLSLALLAVIGVIAWRSLPPLAALNFLLVLAFGCFIFKAAYTQSELLFYTLNLATFVAMWQLLRDDSPKASVVWGVVAGVLAALAHLTKASMLPLVAIFLSVFLMNELAVLARTRLVARSGWRLAAALLVAVGYLGVLYPYIANSKRVHDQYFYNLNTSLLMWYDSYAQASVAIPDYGPDGWPKGPRRLRPGPLRYWREHAAADIAARFGRGFQDMVTRSYRTFWYLKFVAIYLALAAALVATARRAFLQTARRNLALFAFLALYAAVYLPAIAFYEPISGTGTTRFLMAHVAPLLFACSALFAAEPFRNQRWRVAGLDLTPAHVQLFVLGSIALDVTFTLWPRLMDTYGGF
jgi:hypothetical protein